MLKFIGPVVLTVVFASPASAMCLQMRSNINGAVDYLLCLHNEHVDLLNQHGASINALSKAARLADSNGQEAARRIDALETEVRDLRDEVDALKARR